VLNTDAPSELIRKKSLFFRTYVVDEISSATGY
jgi:hypothetical protein